MKRQEPSIFEVRGKLYANRPHDFNMIDASKLSQIYTYNKFFAMDEKVNSSLKHIIDEKP